MARPPNIDYHCKNCLDKQVWQVCKCCTCDELIPLRNKSGKIINYKHGHFVRNHKELFSNLNSGKCGFENPNWKFGRYKSGKYWQITLPDYYSADSCGRVVEHVYFYEQKNKLCMLPWGHVHHIDHNKENNMPWNLKGMPEWEHIRLHMLGNQYGKLLKKDMSDRVCKICSSDKTYIDKRNNYAQWYLYEDGFICRKCHEKYIRYPQRYPNAYKRKLNSLLERICCNCGSKTTALDKNGKPKWLRGKEENTWLCQKCYDKIRNQKKKLLNL